MNLESALIVMSAIIWGLVLRILFLRIKLETAESIIEFYASANNWNAVADDYSYTIIYDDSEPLMEDVHMDTIEFGGKRARSYLKKSSKRKDKWKMN